MNDKNIEYVDIDWLYEGVGGGATISLSTIFDEVKSLLGRHTDTPESPEALVAVFKKGEEADREGTSCPESIYTTKLQVTINTVLKTQNVPIVLTKG